MKKFLILWLFLIFTKLAVTAALYSSIPADGLKISLNKGSIALAVGLVVMLILATIRTRHSEAEVRAEKTHEVAAHPIAA